MTTDCKGGQLKAIRVALRYLSQRPRTVVEVQSRLRRHCFTENMVTAATEHLLGQGLLNDENFARSWRESRERNRPRSASMVRRELIGKGVSPDVADGVVMGMDDVSMAYRAGLTRVRRLWVVEYETFVRRLGQYLARRGFGSGVVRYTVARLWQERQQVGAYGVAITKKCLVADR